MYSQLQGIALTPYTGVKIEEMFSFLEPSLLFQKSSEEAEGVAHLVEFLLSAHEASSSVPSPAQPKRRLYDCNETLWVWKQEDQKL